MTGSTRTSEGLDARRRRALFRTWHRGIRELELLLGPYADAHIGDLSDHDLADFEALLDVPDDVLLNWLVGRTPVAEESRTRAFQSIIDFHARAHDQS